MDELRACIGTCLGLPSRTMVLWFSAFILSAASAAAAPLELEIVPRLVRQLDGPEVIIASRDLTMLGPDAGGAAFAITKRIPAAQGQVRNELFAALDAVHGDTDTVVPVLESWLDGEDRDLRNWSASSVARYKPATDFLAPKIAKLFETDRIDFNFAADSLGEFGPTAISGLPALKKHFSEANDRGTAISAALLIDAKDPLIRTAASEVLSKGNEDEKCRVATSILSLPERDAGLIEMIAREDVLKGRALSCYYRLPKLMSKFGLLKKTADRPDGPPLPTESGLRLSLKTTKTSFMVGELIPITLHLEYDGKSNLSVDRKNYDRSGRMMHLGFEMRDAHGALVPDPDNVPSMSIAGGIFGTEILNSSHPYEQTADVNEWFRLDHPGRYFLTSAPTMVHSSDAGYLAVKSAPLAIVVVPATRDFFAKSISEIRDEMKSSDQWERARAADRLRFLLDPRAIPDLMAALEDSFGNVRISARYGLIAFADPEIVARAVREAIEAGHPEDSSVIPVYAELLARSESRIEIDTLDLDGMEGYQRALTRWRLTLENHRARRLANEELTPAKALNAVENGISTADDPGVCEKALEGFLALSQNDRFYHGGFIWHCRTARLLPQYRRFANDPDDTSGLRTDAIAYLHDLNDSGWEHPIFADLESNNPKLGADTYRLAIQVSTSAVAQRLLAALESGEDKRVFTAARALSSLDIPSDPKRVLFVAEHGLSHDVDGIARINLAAYLARVYPDVGGPLLERMLRGDFPLGRMAGATEIIRSFAYVPPRISAGTVRRLLSSKDMNERTQMAFGLLLVLRDDRQSKADPCFYFPDALSAYESTPTRAASGQIEQFLQACSGIPSGSEDQADLPKLWHEWWKSKEKKK